ncbi:uroporphyrinogen-III synthase [Stomoxys calcitrans]|uniref:Uroporphyrinogen-III synthase n=1 Tax=Stomoxys calcitrans TaxID=35570 RepID=A0A1I8PF36_STOCA|nr:uroporphyrinogen-III synthase [Stomoxys calcitrans]
MNRQRTVIIFKSESESTDVYAAELKHHFFHPIFVPTLSFGFKNLEKLCAKLQHPDDYEGIIFTSPRCVEAVCKALDKQELPGGWKMLRNYAVGEVTHNMVHDHLQQLFTHGKQTGNARALAEFIIEAFEGDKDKPLLIPCSNLAQDTLTVMLKEDGFRIDACEVYETKCSPDLSEKMDEALKAENIEFLAFFSPSGVNCASEYFKAKNIPMDKYRLVAIGPSTRRALENKGLKVYCTAERPTVEHLIKVLINPQESRENLLKESQHSLQE